MDEIKSRRGVYYDLSKSPYVYQSPYGDLFKFSSQKKLDIYTRDIEIEQQKLSKSIKRNDLELFLPDEIIQLIRRELYQAFYARVERLANGEKEQP